MNKYETTDLALAAFLKSQGFEINSINTSNKKSIFIFEDSPNRKDIVMSFYKDGTVKISEFLHAWNELKSMIKNV